MFPLVIIYIYTLMISLEFYFYRELSLESLSVWLEALNCFPAPESPRMCQILSWVLKTETGTLHANMLPKWPFCSGLDHILQPATPGEGSTSCLIGPHREETLNPGKHQLAKTYWRYSHSLGPCSASPPQGGPLGCLVPLSPTLSLHFSAQASTFCCLWVSGRTPHPIGTHKCL